jgi:peptidyl-prolyl cis-trans isomerase SurA
MVYPFESKAYATEVGTVSMPFRTQFGYHVLKVLDKRRTRGTITAAHIMVANEQEDSSVVPEKRIDLIYQRLQQGESFEDLAKQFSDDKGSAGQGGELRPFKSGELSSPEFEDAAFSIESDGAYSKPFKSAYGWHIVKRKKIEPLRDFNSMKTSLENKVKRDARSKVIKESMVKELRARYDIFEDPEAKNYFVSVFDATYFQNSFRFPESFPGGKKLFTINNKEHTYQGFATYALKRQAAYYNKNMPFDLLYERLYAEFFESAILKFREENLVNENPEYARVLKEYRDGLLLFELMEKEIWNKAANDTLGLRNYYESNKQAFVWPERINLIMASSKDEKALKRIQPKRLSAEGLEDLKAVQRKKGTDVLFTSGLFEAGDPVLPSDLKIEIGSAIYEHNNSFHLIKILEVIPSGLKSFEEAKGEVVNQYQTEIEKNWIESLREKYPVWVDQQVLDDLKEN